MIKQAKTLLLGCLMICALLMTGITGTPTNLHASAYNNNGGPIVTETTPLFMWDGTYNQNLVTQLHNLSRTTERGEPNLHADHHGVTGITVSDAGSIRTTNDGQLPIIQLFESHGTFSTSGMTAGTTNDQSRNNFTHSNWQLVYITHPEIGDPVFTFRMVETYRNNRMHTPNDDWANTVRYEGSDLRSNLTTDFDNVLNLFDNPVQARNHFVAPVNLPGGWQDTQPDVGNPINQSLVGDASTDLIWIPSAYEVGGSSGQNLWQLTLQERAHVQNGFNQWAWLRSGQQDRPYLARTINATTSSAENVTLSFAIVPALHLTLSEIIHNITTAVNPTQQDAGTVTVTGGNAHGIFAGEQRTLTATPNTGWNFIGWSVEGYTVTTPTLSTINVTVNGNITATANFERINYDVAAPASGTGFTIGGLSSTNVNHGQSFTFTLTLLASHSNANPTITLPATLGTITRSGTSPTFTFTVSGILDYIEPGDFTVAPLNINTYQVTFNMGGRGDTPIAQTIDHGALATLPTQPTATGYIFKDWYTDDTFTTKFDFDTMVIESTTTIFAHWIADKTPLTQAITNAEALDLTGYTQASIDALNTAIANAKHVLGNPDATSAQITQAIDALNIAIAGLETETDDDDFPWLIVGIVAGALFIFLALFFTIRRIKK